MKVYTSVNAKKEDSTFEISLMEEIYDRRKGATDEPHRHSFYTVMVIQKARGYHHIDFNTYKLAPQQLFFVAPGQVHQVEETEKSYGYAMTFSNQFLLENSIPISFIESLNLFHDYGQSPPLQPDRNDFERIINYCKEIVRIARTEDRMKNLSVGAYLKLMLIECNKICSINPIESDVDSSGDNLIRSFKSLVDQHYKSEHSSAFYAEKLAITSDHLNRTFKSKIGKTAKEYILSRITTEAKRLLYFTDLSNKEIGYELGFSEPANFSAFFKKQTGSSPSAFSKAAMEG